YHFIIQYSKFSEPKRKTGGRRPPLQKTRFMRVALTAAHVDPPGPKNPLVGLIPRRDGLSFMTNLAAQYGDIVYFRRGAERFYLISNPDYIKDMLLTSARKFAKGRALEKARALLGEGLLTSEGDFHLRQRRLIQPAFHRQHIAAYGESMVQF